MDLIVTDDDIDYGANTYKLTLSEFAQREYHPYIASNTWQQIIIDLNENTPKGIIRQVVPIINVIPRFDKDNITVRVMQLLCEIYPDYSSKIRGYFMTDKKALRDLLDSIEP